MNFFQNLSIRTKLVLLSLVPIIGFLYYLQIMVKADLTSKDIAHQVIRDVEVVEGLSRLVHEFQRERALSLTFLYGGTAETRNAIAAQREDTDNAIFELERILNAQARVVKDYGLIDSLALVRAKVDITRPDSEIDPFYRDIKAILLDGVAEILRSSQNLELKNHFEEHLFLLHSKEFLAQIRTELSLALTKHSFGGVSYGTFAAAKGKHEVNLAKFKKIASSELQAEFKRKYDEAMVRQTYQAIDLAFADPILARFPYNNDRWWDMATSSINALKQVEDFSNDFIRRKATEQLQLATRRVNQNLVVAFLMALFIFVVVAYTVKGLTSSVNNIKNAADRMAQGDVNAIVRVASKDEIGSLAASFNEMIRATKKFADVANTIGKGDYTAPVDVRGANDTLGIALNDMRNDLKNLSEENATRTWLLTGNSELSDAMRGEKEVKSLAQDVIIRLVNHLHAQVGIIYLVNNNHLELVGSYAFENRKENANYVKLGEGLVGQAALEKKPIIFNSVPENYIRVKSGLGHSSPRNIIVFPFLFDSEVKGVIEIGSVDEFSDLTMQFLNMVGENVAVSFAAAQSREKLKELLEETQRQAEELEAQQEELRQSNEQLHEKTNLLEKSESELKAQQEQLQQSNEELEEKANLLEEQKEKLEHAKMEIENKARDLEVTSKYKSEFLANMSHELRTPLNSILILSQLLAENKSNVLGEKEVDFCKNIYNSGADLLNLINEILDLSKVESGRMQLDIAECGLPEFKSSMQSMFTEVAKHRSIDFSVQLQEKLKNRVITTDRQRVEQILKNLLSNAFKFSSEKGSVHMEIKQAAQDLPWKNGRLNDVSEIVEFSVKDNGIGIPASKLGVIFEAFQQADGSTKRKYGGTGLGLSISRELAHALGGEIHVESEEGKGSTFTLYLPLQFEASRTSSDHRKIEVKEKRFEAAVANRRRRVGGTVEKLPVTEADVSDDRTQMFEDDKVILIMEDDSEFSKVLLDFVRSRNYKGIVAAAGNTGLSYARQYKPDAILLDMKLPVMDGSEVLRHLKNDPGLRHIPVQIISGYDHRKESLELGAFDFVSKPISKDDLKNAFDRIEEFMLKKLKNLLIIEDDVNQNNAIRELIGNGDVKSHSAFSGTEAYQMMAKLNYDCVILDLGLPDMSGFEFLDRIKRDQRLAKVPIVIYTGRDLSRDEHSALLKFANTVVLKTVNSHERLLDETMLFLHRVESRLPKEKQTIIRKLHKTDEVLKNRKILVVDDDIRNIYSLTHLLEEQGMNCITAENGKIALRKLKESSDIDLVLMDVMMPEMDGYEATKAIRSIESFAKLPVIALTANAMKGDREKCLNAGMSDYIAKPLNIEQLLSLMRIWLYK